MFPQSFGRIFLFSKKSTSKNTLQDFPGVREMGDVSETPPTVPNYNTPVTDLTYKDLLTSTFTLASHDRGIKTWCVPATYPECVYCGKRYRYERFNVECHMDPNIGKETDKERTVSPLYRAKNHYQHHVVLIENVSWNCRQKSVRLW